MPALAFERMALCCPSLLYQLFLSTSLEAVVLKLRLRERRVNDKASYNVPQCGSAMATAFYFPAPWFARRTPPSLWMPETLLMKARFSLKTPLSMCEKKHVEKSPNPSGCFLCAQPLSCSGTLGKCTDPRLL